MGETPAPLRAEDPAAVGGYRLLGVLGVGGMGTVYLAAGRDDRRVALKVINPAWHGDPQFRHRFAAEAAAASRVAGFCTARVLDVALDGPVPHLVTEYVPGPSLHDYATVNGPLAGQVESVAVGVAAALTAVHAVGLVHADLSPRNVLLSPFGPKVIDFGVARLLGHTGPAGQLFGTPGWLAPEQLRGAPPSQASDVYAWGLLVAWAATGSMPRGPAIHAPGLSAALTDVVGRALHPDPAHRPTARQVLLALVGDDDPAAVRLSATGRAAFQRGTATVVGQTVAEPFQHVGREIPLPPPPPPPRRAPRRTGRGVFAGVLLVLLLGCLLGVLKLAESAGSGGSEASPSGGPAKGRSASPSPTPKPSPVVTDGGLRFTVAGFTCGAPEIGQWPVTRKPEGQFCLVELRVENLGKGSGRVWLGSQRLRDTADKEYKPDEWSWLYYDATRPLLNEVKAGKTVTGTLVFDVPKDVTFDELVVKEQPLSDGTALRLP